MSLYLKYRPQDFDSLEWQEFIKNTLKKAVFEDKTVWAYLFCWPRWTGKTSTARIFAKAINCLDPKNWNPCLDCSICRDFLDEKLIDIIEIDAASYTWVDNIRDIIEKSQFRPTKCKYKVYIIDEVHMLSKWAFNALLKILEEPPEFVKFILATTETHKVPETILSRCQRYDFKNGSYEELKNRLEFIAKNESIKIDDKSLDYIIKNSSWWYRNAISLFEQLVVDKEIKYENIIDNLWLVNIEKIESFLDKLLSKNPSIIDDFEDIKKSWKNVNLFFKELIFYVKNNILDNLKSNKNISDLLFIFEILVDSFNKLKNSFDENTTLLIWILKIIDKWWGLSPELNQEKKQKLPKSREFKSPENKELKEEKIQEGILTHSDIWDIFWLEEEIKNDDKVAMQTISSFDKESFISKLKDNGAKWSLTMSIRWADTFLDKDILNISFKTKFALNSVNNSDNIWILNKALSDLWFWDIQLKLS